MQRGVSDRLDAAERQRRRAESAVRRALQHEGVPPPGAVHGAEHPGGATAKQAGRQRSALVAEGPTGEEHAVDDRADDGGDAGNVELADYLQPPHVRDGGAGIANVGCDELFGGHLGSGRWKVVSVQSDMGGLASCWPGLTTSP